ncbi:hypothetical protein NDU88_000378 [Pleurodeles waltl]|uniref:Uncharacterized protein n=1 Tax=Pleurodeles waltl TaxID=8319 RepID=A0AAV7MIP8_PLEWA|nr:hypothetical protein NDU88_000378 [Pleurodeles waltl]
MCGGTDGTAGEMVPLWIDGGTCGETGGTVGDSAWRNGWYCQKEVVVCVEGRAVSLERDGGTRGGTDGTAGD